MPSSTSSTPNLRSSTIWKICGVSGRRSSGGMFDLKFEVSLNKIESRKSEIATFWSGQSPKIYFSGFGVSFELFSNFNFQISNLPQANPAPQHFLYFFPLPHGHRSFRPTFGASFTIVWTFLGASPSPSSREGWPSSTPPVARIFSATP